MGSLFKPNFRRKPIDSREYFCRLIAYIHNNPVHHGFVKDLNNWPHSSWFAYLIDKETKINKEKGIKWFGGRDAFKTVHRELNTEKLISIFEDMY
jgi:hypothetical protein